MFKGGLGAGTYSRCGVGLGVCVDAGLGVRVAAAGVDVGSDANSMVGSSVVVTDRMDVGAAVWSGAYVAVGTGVEVGSDLGVRVAVGSGIDARVGLDGAVAVTWLETAGAGVASGAGVEEGSLPQPDRKTSAQMASEIGVKLMAINSWLRTSSPLGPWHFDRSAMRVLL